MKAFVLALLRVALAAYVEENAYRQYMAMQIGDPYVFNGYEQNYQWINPDTPMDKRNHKVKPAGPSLYGTDFSREGIKVGAAMR